MNAVLNILRECARISDDFDAHLIFMCFFDASFQILAEQPGALFAPQAGPQHAAAYGGEAEEGDRLL